MTKKDVQVNFRMPEALKAELEIASKANNRSLTAEIVSRLEDSFTAISAEEFKKLKGQVAFNEGRAAGLESGIKVLSKYVKQAIDNKSISLSDLEHDLAMMHPLANEDTK